jgi:photosystem II stability/assembly factor-like uncharacterized protein
MKTVLFALALLLPQARASAQYIEARSLAATPQVLYLGTSVGTIYTSHDQGVNWEAFTSFGSQYVIDRILTDGNNIYVAMWYLKNPNVGSFFRSLDGGKTWELTLQQSLRGLAVSGQTLIAGGIDGVWRSKDRGATWEQISDITDVQSVAVDPAQPNYIFVGTWHLGYATHNGGVTWHPIDKGLINDSDFFTIILDKTDPSTIYIGACSGIYKGNDDGEQYKKLNTIKDARRTKVLYQVDKNTIYAGTTDGVFLSTNGGNSWKRQSDEIIIVNDMLVIGRDHLVVASLKHGVVFSADGGRNFYVSHFEGEK